jgi:hypothetical protein
MPCFDMVSRHVRHMQLHITSRQRDHFPLKLKLSLVNLFKNAAHCNENPIYVFIFWELRGLSPNLHIHVSVSDLYILRISQQAAGK